MSPAKAPSRTSHGPAGGAAGDGYQAARLRWAGLNDAEALLELFQHARPEENESLAGMRDWLEHGGAVLLERDDGKPLCALRWREEAGGWRVDRIATLPAARGQGFGRWLMTKVEALAIRYNIPVLTLTLPADTDPELVPYYRRLGYAPAAPAAAADAAGTTLTKRVGGTWQYQHASERTEPRT